MGTRIIIIGGGSAGVKCARTLRRKLPPESCEIVLFSRENNLVFYLDGTDWDRYGTGRNEKCADCMVHCGYEASAVADTFGSWRGFYRTIRAMRAPTHLEQPP